MDGSIIKLVSLIGNSRSIVVFTGAGVSTESGISDFRSPGGIWDRFNPSQFTYRKFLNSAKNRQKHWKFYQEGILGDENTQPNPAHYAIAGLWEMDKLNCVITQNVDNLHQKAGIPEEKVVELHGNMRRVKCLSCGKRTTMAEVIEKMRKQGIEEPYCEKCNGILKPEGIFFGESLPDTAIKKATFHSQNCDLFIVIGSSLVVTPAAFMPNYAVQNGAKLVIINLMPTPLDQHAAVLIQDKAGEVMCRVMERIWRG